MQLVRQGTRLENHIHAILARNLIPPCPAADLFGPKGTWLARPPSPATSRPPWPEIVSAILAWRKATGWGQPSRVKMASAQPVAAPSPRDVDLASSKGPGD